MTGINFTTSKIEWNKPGINFTTGQNDWNKLYYTSK